MIRSLFVFAILLAQTMQQGIVNTPVSGSIPGNTVLQITQKTICGSVSSCAITVASTATGSGMAVGITTPNATHITSVTGGGGTWTLCAASACVNSPSSSANGTLDAAYNLSGAGGATSITVNLNAASTGFFLVQFVEFKKSSGSWTLDTKALGSFQSSCTTCNGAAFSPSGASDMYIQWTEAANTGAGSVVSSPYTVANNGNAMYAINTNSSATPTMTQSPTGYFFTTGLAFK